MTFAHEAVAALPSGANADAALIRAMCERRFAYVLDASEDSRNFVAVDPVSGVLPLYLIQNAILFQYDSTDSTTVWDGVTCLVTSDGKRYKTNGVTVPYSVLSRTTSAQPGSPTVGDNYIIPTAATGAAWAGQDGKIGLYGPRGWQFAVSPIGREIYVRDVDAYYHRNTSGVWTGGVGSIALQTNSVTIQNVLGAKASFTLKVENRTTNSPPASPTAPTAYIIGPSPTGAWAGNAGVLAVCLVNGSFTLIGPDEGDQVYDKATQTFYTFRSSAWQAEAGAWLVFKQAFTQGTGSVSSTGGTSYAYSATTAPSKTTNPNRLDDTGASITHTARKTGALLRIKYRARIATASVVDGGSGAATIGLCLDSNAAAIGWDIVPFGPVGAAGPVSLMSHGEFVVSAIDTNSHIYSISLFNSTTGASIGSIDHRLLTLEEAS
jgi:hypothetical protein